MEVLSIIATALVAYAFYKLGKRERIIRESTQEKIQNIFKKKPHTRVFSQNYLTDQERAQQKQHGNTTTKETS